MKLGHASQLKPMFSDEYDPVYLEAERGENGRWYHNNIEIPTSIAQNISAFQQACPERSRRDEIRIAVTGHRDEVDKRTVEAAKWWICRIAQKYPQATIITGCDTCD